MGYLGFVGTWMVEGFGGSGIRLANFIIEVRCFLRIHSPSLSEPDENLRIEK